MFGAPKQKSAVPFAGLCPISTTRGRRLFALCALQVANGGDARAPRPIPSSGPRKSEVVIFTDGSVPGSCPKDPAAEMIGGATFMPDDAPRQFSSGVPFQVMQRWCPSKTQIV